MARIRDAVLATALFAGSAAAPATLLRAQTAPMPQAEVKSLQSKIEQLKRTDAIAAIDSKLAKASTGELEQLQEHMENGGVKKVNDHYDSTERTISDVLFGSMEGVLILYLLISVLAKPRSDDYDDLS